MLANAAAMNYGFAFRVATYAALRRLAAETFGGATGRLVVDSPHNSIYEEPVGEAPAVVHRHNSCRAYPAEMMPAGTTFATDRSGGAAARHAPHVLATSRSPGRTSAAQPALGLPRRRDRGLRPVVRRGLSDTDPEGRSTLRFRYTDAAPTGRPHFDDNGVNAALGVLVGNGLVTPVARMRPIAVLH